MAPAPDTKRETSIARFCREDDGAILLLVAGALAILLGLIGLSFDVGRISATQSELQSYADQVALAAAGELDGEADAIARAQSAAANLISDMQTFGDGGQDLAGALDYTLTFHATLPAQDVDPITAATTDPSDAIYARVLATPRRVPFSFAAAFFAMTGNPEANNIVGAEAVAGFTQYACDITPLMFCIPHQNFDAADPAEIGRMILLRSGGQGAAWGPGDFGFLDPSKSMVDERGPCAGLSGGRLDRCLNAAEGALTRCFPKRGVDTEPGQKVGFEDAAFNVRFDIYRSTMNTERNNPVFRPAPNVIKGIVPKGGGMCIGANPEASPNTVPLPRDACFANGTCTRYGDGNWSAARPTYVARNHGGTDPDPTALTRWELYKAEIAHAAGGPILTGTDATGNPLAETGLNQCSPHVSADPERRIVIGAGIDCTANPVNGQMNNVPVHQFVKLFLTEPVSSNGTTPPQLDVYVEIVGPAGGPGSGSPTSGGIFRDVVQLYR